MSVSEFVAGVDRLLARAHGLFVARGGDAGVSGGWWRFGAGGACWWQWCGHGCGTAGGAMSSREPRSWGWTPSWRQAAAEGGAVAEQGRTGAGSIRDQARTVAAAMAPMGNSAAGARLIVAAMDQHLAAMQGQIADNHHAKSGLATQLRQVAEGYREVARGEAKAHHRLCRWIRIHGSRGQAPCALQRGQRWVGAAEFS